MIFRGADRDGVPVAGTLPPHQGPCRQRPIAGARRASTTDSGGTERQQGSNRWTGRRKALLSLIIVPVLVAALGAWLIGLPSKIWDHSNPGPVLTAEVGYSSCESSIIPQTVEVGSAAPSIEEQEEWALARNGAQAVVFQDEPTRGYSEVLVTVTGYEEREVTVTGLTFQVV